MKSFSVIFKEGQNEDRAKFLLKKHSEEDAFPNLLAITEPYKTDPHGKNNKHLPKLVDYYLHGVTLDLIKSYYDKFMANKKLSHKPIDNLSFNDFAKLIDSAIEKSEKVSSEDEITDKPFYEDENVKIYKGTDRNSCVRYGKGKKYGFCISRPDSSNVFHNYRKESATFYFIYFKNDKAKALAPTDLIVIHAYPNNKYQINYVSPNKDHNISKEDIEKEFPVLQGILEKLSSEAHSEKEKHMYNVIQSAKSILNLQTAQDQLLWVELGGKIKDDEWDKLLNPEYVLQKYIEVGDHDIPQNILQKYPKLQERYEERLGQRVDIKNQPHDIRNLTQDEQRWALAHNILQTHPAWSYYYARNVLRGRYPEGEAAISQDPIVAFSYAKHVIKGPWLLGEPAIASAPNSAFAYAKEIIKGPWKPGEDAIKSDPVLANQYKEFLNKHYNTTTKLEENSNKSDLMNNLKSLFEHKDHEVIQFEPSEDKAVEEEKPATFCYMLYLTTENQNNIEKLRQSLDLHEGSPTQPEEFHCTINYCKMKPGQSHQPFVDWMNTMELPKLIAYTEKFSIFGPEQDVLVAELESQDLHEWQAKIAGWLDANGYPPSDYPKYKPHITLSEGVKDCPKFDKFKHRIRVEFTIHKITNKDKIPVFIREIKE